MSYRIVCFLLFALMFSIGCTSSQSVKNTWKGTKNAWYSYVNVPAAIDYDDTGKMPDYETLFSRAMMGIDVQLQALERTMQNSDKPPTPEWLNTFFTQFPWVDGITGLNGEGGIVGQAGRTEKELDFSPLLENTPKQNLFALRGHVQDSDSGPEVLLAVPLYDGPDFLGLVVAYFEMSSLIKYSDAPDELIVTSPAGPLWSGSSVGTLPDADWKAITRSSTSGTISGASGKYQWVSRFLGDTPLIFAVQKTSGTAREKAQAESAPREESTVGASDTAPGIDETAVNLELPPLPKL